MRVPSSLIGPLLVVLAAASADAEQNALERLQAAITSAWQAAPQIVARGAALDGEAAMHRADAAPGSPSLEWQREGIGPSFSHRSNAQTSVRLAAPFVPPWEWADKGELDRGLISFVDSGTQAAHQEIAAQVARNWLELAATLDELEVARGRLDRLTQAVALQTHRRDFGEVAGLDVVQLDLERLHEAGRVHRLEAAATSASARLAELTGPDPPTPAPGDLAALVGLPSTLPAGEELEAMVAAGPLGRAATSSALVQGARADLVSKAAWGRPEAEAEWEHFPSLEGLPGYDAVGLRLNWPLPIGGAGRERAASVRAEASAAEASAAATLRELESRVHAAVATARGAGSVLDEARPVMEKLSQTEHSLSEQFRLGAISYLVYIDGLSRLDDVRTQVIGARLELLGARVELATMLGSSDVFPLPEVSP